MSKKNYLVMRKNKLFKTRTLKTGTKRRENQKYSIGYSDIHGIPCRP